MKGKAYKIAGVFYIALAVFSIFTIVNDVRNHANIGLSNIVHIAVLIVWMLVLSKFFFKKSCKMRTQEEEETISERKRFLSHFHDDDEDEDEEDEDELEYENEDDEDYDYEEDDFND